MMVVLESMSLSNFFFFLRIQLFFLEVEQPERESMLIWVIGPVDRSLTYSVIVPNPSFFYSVFQIEI